MTRAERYIGNVLARMLVLVVLGLGVAPGCATPLETTGMQIPESNWRVGFAHDFNRKLFGFLPGPGYGQGTIVEFIRENEHIERWTRLITIQFFEGVMEAPEDYAERARADLAGLCPDLVWKVLSEQPNSVTYVWSISGCSNQDDQEEIVRLLRGNDGLHRVAFTQKPTISNLSRSKWVDMIEGAKVMKDGEEVQVN